MATSLKQIKPSIDGETLKIIQRFLFSLDDSDESSFSEPNTSKDDSSQWEDSDTESEESEESSGESDNSRKESSSKGRRLREAWLQNVFVSTIPTFEFYVFARRNRIAAIESNAHNDQWTILFQKQLPDSDITSVACLPVAPSRVSDPRPYEWTAILTGTSDGRVTAYNERGDELLTRQFYAKSIIEIRQESDQLLVTYPDNLITVSGYSLLASLKSNRQRLVRKNVQRSQEEQHGSSVDSQLVYDSWHLDNVSHPTSVAATGPRRTTTWEKLVTASVKGGFNAGVSNRQPSYETYCATNRKNFVSFNWWTDETPPNLLAGIASRIKSSVSVPLFSSSWWSPSKPTSKPSDGSATQPALSRDIPQRGCLPDSGRSGEKLVLSPGSRLAAACDDLGRVSMFDSQRRLLLRMWKGYRDAECAWMELPYSGSDKSDGGTRSSVLCLVIFAPRRGILEVWSVQNGGRVCAFNVDRKGRLLYSPTTSITRSNSVDYSQATRFMDSTGRCFRIDVSTAAVTQRHETATYWTVPARDDFRKRWNRNLVDESSLAALLDVLGRLVWIKDITYLVDRVLQASKIDYKLFVQFIDSVISRLSKSNDQSLEAKSLCIRCSAYRQVTHFVALLFAFYDDGGSRSNEPVSDQEVHHLLALQTSEELDDLLRDLDENLKIRCAVSLEDDTPKFDQFGILQRFLSSIDYRLLSHVNYAPGTNIALEETLPLRFKRDIDEILADIGDFVFKPFMTGLSTVNEFRRTAQPLWGLANRDWLRLFCAYWLNKNRSYSVHPEQLYNLFSALLAQSDEKDGEFLREVRRSIIDCSRIAEALCLCTVVRAILKNSTSSDDSEWLKIEKNVEDWDILQTTLHAMLLLDTCSRSLVSGGNPKSTFESTTLRRLLTTGGAGHLSEFFAKSFVDSGLTATIDCFTNATTRATWIDSLMEARKIMPLSLETERLILAILWEYVRVWYRTPSRTDCLESANNLLACVQDERLRQGFASLAWRTFCCQYYEKLCTIMMNSNGKDCSDAFESEAGIPATGLLVFVRFVYELFNVMKESVERWEECVAKPYETEEFLNNFFVALRHDVSDERTGNRESLWQLLSRQPVNSKYRIELHWQLAAAILVGVSTHFEIRLAPFSLFSWDERTDFFKSLSQTSKDVDGSRLTDEDAEQHQLDNRRLLFLLSYVTVAIKSSLPSATAAHQLISEKNLLPDLSLAVKLARSWNLNFDAVRRQEIVQLYLAGHPDLASKLLPLVEDRRQLATTLLDIAGCALCDRWSAKQMVMRPKMSSNSWNWLVSKKSAVAKGPELSVDSCDSMLAYVSSALSPGTAEQKISEELRLVIETLK